MNYFYPKNQVQGFTLVELLVVLGLFSAIATLSLGSLLNAQTLNNKLQETQSILDNVNLSSQTVTRDIRFGSDFYCATALPASITVVPTTRKNCPYGADGSNSGSVLIFKPADATNNLDRVAYYVKNGVLYKDEYPRGGTTNTLQMTANEVTMSSLIFYVDGALASDPNDPVNELVNGVHVSDYKQPLITFLLSGATNPATKINAPIPFDLETSISARDLDNR